ncbi:TetR/AcrR family transcriptional regulator [Gordonia sp. ABSL11-1]|uniref:TetR/AcrR family transcriptional regulator n=1 Tax=Gordonia sp. ABSL11-1 TaxID=3053924 RepID=UPI0025741F54|nr:TetR/AcrR family transcriptional regulator [Gordonia sp. ABSL11-1]MDL9945188.1 TetR/AcrR family transcriptional regulator [Gordonia sp. ABSL11-1]
MSDSRTVDWLATDRAELGTQRILDVAERLFIEHGVAAVTMRSLATAVGCSRATLYRYFPGKSEVLAAYVERAAAQVGVAIAGATDGTSDPGTRLIAAVMTAVEAVRANPALSAWFTADTAGASANLALLSPAIEEIVRGFLADIRADDGGRDPDAADLRERGRWLVRVIVSLLTTPGRDPDDERAMLEQFVVPVVLGP